MYEFILGLHNIVRWIVLLAGIAAVVVALRGLFTRANWGDTERRIGSIFAGSIHLQVVIGFILYFVSPLIRSGMSDFGAAMSDPNLRFFLTEHLVIMILAAIVAQVGASLARRAKTDRAAFTRASVGFVLALALIFYGIPWDRPALPF